MQGTCAYASPVITVWFARWLALACFLAATGSLPSRHVDNPTGRPLPTDVSFSAGPMKSQDFMRGTGLVSFAPRVSDRDIVVRRGPVGISDPEGTEAGAVLRGCRGPRAEGRG